MKSSLKSRVIIFAILISIVSLGIGAGTAAGESSSTPLVVKSGPTTLGDSLSFEQLQRIKVKMIASPPYPPKGVQRLSATPMPQSSVMLQVPTSRWTFGCSATSAGMLFGYYDRNGYPNMYAGPTNGGVAPMHNLGQGPDSTPDPCSCSIIATQNGFDGRTTRGHVNDYWVVYENAGPDPWEGHWTEHAWSGCTADFMGTNQWKWDYDLDGTKEFNVDGGTAFFYDPSGAKLYDFVPPSECGLPATEGCHGMRMFAESRGYTVLENYTQVIDTQIAGGFSLANYRTEINSGYPVLIQLEGHTMVGVGYESASSQTIYVNDTWDNIVHSMTWGGTYSSMLQWGVTVIHLNPSPPGQAAYPNPANGAINVKTSADVNWTAGTYAASHNVNFGTTNPPTFRGNQTSTTYDPGTMANGTTYYWRIDEQNSSGLTTGLVWSFTTIARQSLDVSTTTNGTVTTPGIGRYWYDCGSDANIAASANANCYFINWTGTAVTAGKVSNPNSPNTAVRMDANYTVQANFAIYQRELKISSTAGGTTTPAAGAYLYDHGTNVNISASANANCYFINWTGTAVTAGKVTNPNLSSTTVLMDANYTVQANFANDAVKTIWTQKCNGSANGSDYAQDIALDSAGNAYVTGYVKNTGTNYDFVTIKYTSDGDTAWTRTYNCPDSYTDFAYAIAVDANSDIIVAGYSYTTMGYDGIIIKYTSSGNQLWTKAYNYSGASDEIFYDVATDASKNIYAVGGKDNDCLIVKYTPDGTLAWARTYNGPANGSDSLYHLAIDASGNVYACGESAGIGTDQDCLTLKYSPAGNLLWSKTYNGSVNGWDLLESVAVDSAGNAYVTGSVETETDTNYVTIKYLSNGDSPWTAFYSGTAAGGHNEAYAIAITSDGNVVVTGSSNGTAGTDAATVKYDSQTGAQVWASRYNGAASSTDYTEAIAADHRGNVYVTGRSAEGSSTDYLTICYGSNGTELWKMNYNGPVSQTDFGTAIAVNDNAVYVTGCSTDSNSNYDIATIKYAPYLGSGSVKTSIRRQVLKGFGGALVYDVTNLAGYAQSEQIYDLLFKDLGLEFLRIRNTYGEDEYYGDSMNATKTIVAAARMPDRSPALKLELVPWSPPAYLKSNGTINHGGTLARDWSGNYDYTGLAQWWADSLNEWASGDEGLTPDYVSIQNEPDTETSYDSCKFLPAETADFAGYDQAFEAVYNEIYSRMGSNMPNMLAPETMGFGNSESYINSLINLNHVYGFAHHLYSDDPDGGGNYHQPDIYVENMKNYASLYGYKPLFQTEYAGQPTFEDAIYTACHIHNCMVYEEAAAYFYWSLFRAGTTSSGGVVTLINSTNTHIIRPTYYALKQYSYFTDPNWQRIGASALSDVNDSNALKISAYISPDNKQVSVVIINASDSYIQLDVNSLGDFNAAGGEIYRTSRTENCALVGNFENGTPLALPGKSITTVAMTGRLGTDPSCPNRPAGDLNGDCQVDFFDIVELGKIYTGSQANHLTLGDIADTWLECGLTNQTNCWQ